ncbi:hypothetical protein PLESTF_001335100 [Pleodorina starrii]|nr:hypothetical protein PLESTM_000053200 [Pleodorina starrii]GLC73128.1 hypothetical protein PLESTF_001335100 [Pleodorina starrii]
MDRAMNRFINNAFGGSHASTSGSSARAAGSAGQPVIAMDILETPAAYQLHADTPGMSPEVVKVELHQGVLTVSGERKLSHSAKNEGGKVWRSERSSYAFSRAFTLPDNANADAISAAIDKGVLTVTVPKKDPPAKPEPKRIAVTAA